MIICDIVKILRVRKYPEDSRFGGIKED